MAITVDYSTTAPWLITLPQSDLTLVTGTQYSLDVDEFWTLLRDFSDNENVVARPVLYSRIPATSSTPSITEIDLDFYQIEFEDGLYSVNIINGNTNIREAEVKNQVSVNTNNTTGFIDAQFLEHSTFGGGVYIDVTSSNTGVNYPAGTPSTPVNNIADAHVILVSRGFNKFFVVSDMTISTDDFSHGVTFEGLSSISTTLTLEAATNVDNCIFSKFTIDGTLDNNNRLENCLLNTITSFDGFMENCGLNIGVSMGGSAQTTMVNCYSNVAGTATPYLSLGAGSSLAFRGYKGGIELRDKVDDSATSVDMESGQVIVASSCTVGTITLRGTAELENNTGGTYVRDFMQHNTDSAVLRQLIELQRPHHTGMGKIIFWNPHGGDDTRNGDHIDRAVKTFAQAHNLATDNGHDIIVAVSGNPSGNTITNENIVISKNYLFLRGAGRDFKIHSIDDSLDAISITGNGVEVSGMIVSTEVTSTKHCIQTSGHFSLLKNIYCSDSVEGIHITAGNYAQVEECRISHNSKYGIKFDGAAEHGTVLNCHIGSNGTSGIIIDTLGGHELALDNNIIHKNTEYGVDISASASVTVIRGNNMITDNTLGDVNDLASDTVDLRGWVERISDSHGQTIREVFIDTELATNGNGYQQSPYNNWTDAVDYAEANGLLNLVIVSDATVDRQLKNFNIRGIGLPTIDLNGQIMDNTIIERCGITGSHVGAIRAAECAVFNLAGMQGTFLTCSFAGTLTPASGSDLLISRVAPAIAAQPWTLDMNTGTASTVAIHNATGGMIVTNMDDVGDILHFNGSQGEIVIGATNTAGNIVCTGGSKVEDELAGGVTIDKSRIDAEMYLDSVT